MTTKYKGRTSNYNYRAAEIAFNDETEQRFYDRVEQVMKLKGWNLIQVTDGYALCEVNDYDEYKEFVRDYKDVKESIRLVESNERSRKRKKASPRKTHL